MFWGALLGGFGVFCTAALLIAAVRWVGNELAKADPIPGITIVVDTGNAVDPKGIEHAAHAYLNRRLREAGYDEQSFDPLRIEVQFVKVGAMEYIDVDKKVLADKVRVDVKFHDAAGKHLKTISAQPKMDAREEFKYDAEISLNKTVYGRAVGQLLHMEIPSPAELR